jgi:hypothetical protein
MKKAHVDQYFWHVGFAIPLSSAVLGPQQPQARNVCFATATAVAATTHGLAGHSHYIMRVRGVTRSVNAVCARKKMMLANDNLDAGMGGVVMQTKQREECHRINRIHGGGSGGSVKAAGLG